MIGLTRPENATRPPKSRHIRRVKQGNTQEMMMEIKIEYRAEVTVPEMDGHAKAAVMEEMIANMTGYEGMGWMKNSQWRDVLKEWLDRTK